MKMGSTCFILIHEIFLQNSILIFKVIRYYTLGIFYSYWTDYYHILEP